MSKAEGWNVQILDILDQDELRTRARGMASIAPGGVDRIEPVDFVGSACDIAELVPSEMHGSLDYILSSHNFEHLPDPLKFLDGAARLLKPGGLLVMAIPDARGCFDFFRPVTTLGDWIEARFEGRRHPRPRQVFDCKSRLASPPSEDGRKSSGFTQPGSVQEVAIYGGLQEIFDGWPKDGESRAYIDTHCTVVTPAAFELLILEARALGLIDLDLVAVVPTKGTEFFVRLRRSTGADTIDAQTLQARRNALARRALVERITPGDVGFGTIAKARLRKLASPIRTWNRKRRAKRRSR
ncbi:methyltransferase domain-containing protein [Palleronia sp. KMU-117]|uniref:methyltransferase domain-containing protein n=1 Tax=Palleronia sp. KMU-117 TaxID=3434108 RepID=UPI003D739FFB